MRRSRRAAWACLAVALAATAAAAPQPPPAGLEPDGVLFWGNSTASPQPIPSSLPIATIESGSRVGKGAGWAACGLLTNGSAFCNFVAVVEDLGGGQLVPDFAYVPELVVVPGGHTFASLTVSPRLLACGLLANGSALCWGRNIKAAIGIGSEDYELVAEPTAVMPSRSFRQLVAGDQHLCGIDAATGETVCWGSNQFSESGAGPAPVRGENTDTGAAVNHTQPAIVPGSHRFASLAAGGAMACGLTAAGDVWCWGWNDLGQLGAGAEAYASEKPLAVAGGHNFTQLSIGSHHACGVTAEKATFCWGSNRDFQLGVSNVGQSNVPLPVDGGLLFESISADDTHTCGVLLNASGVCFGSNEGGRVGAGGAATFYATPTLVAGGHLFSAISAGRPSYGILRPVGAPALAASSSQPSSPVAPPPITPSPPSEPVATSGGVMAGNLNSLTSPLAALPGDRGAQLVSLAPGRDHYCGLTGDGAAWCAGSNWMGGLGNDLESSTGDSAELVAVHGGLQFSSLVSGNDFTCGLLRSDNATANQTVYCWGDNVGGVMGDYRRCVNSSDPGLPTGDAANGCPVAADYRALHPVPVFPDFQFSLLSAGEQGTIAAQVCGIAAGTRQGQLYCWGSNSYGQLAAGLEAEDVYYLEPQLAQSEPPTNRFTSVSVVAQHVCAIAVDGTLFCAGNNEDGRLGIQDSLNFSTKLLPVAGGRTWAAVNAGNVHTCAIDAETRAAYCWGINDAGQLGDGSYENRRLPVAVAGGHQFAAVSAGDAHTCGVTLNNSGRCWGDNSNGKLMIGAAPPEGPYRVNIPTPIQGGSLYNFSSLEAGDSATFGILHAATAAAAPSAAPRPPPPSPSAPQPSPPAEIAAPPSVAPVPPEAAGTTTTGRSPSAAVIAGAVVGGLVAAACLAVLAFLAQRPGKGWLRQQPAARKERERLESGAALPEHAGSDKPTPTASSLKAVSAMSATYSGATSVRSDAILSALAGSLAAICAGQPTATGMAQTAVLQSGELQQWHVSWDDLHMERLLGRGSFGRVYLARWDETPVAVKVLLTPDMVEQGELQLPPGVLRELQEEAAVMSRMRHPNLLNFLGLCTLPPCIITEYCGRGSLFDVLQAASRDPARAAELTWRRRLGMALDGASGLLYLHRRTPPIIHRDIKSPNLLLDDNWRVKVADFNLSKILAEQPTSTHSSTCGATNPVWLAPEVLLGGSASAASDVYAFGLVMLELLTWRLPWPDMEPWVLVSHVLEGGRPEVPAWRSAPGANAGTLEQHDAYCVLMRECWAQDPAQRPLFMDIVPRLKALLDQCVLNAISGSSEAHPIMLA